MSLPDSAKPNIIHFDPDRHKFDDPNLEQLFRDISSGVKELKRRNQQLEERNAELLEALNDANQRLARLEQSGPTDEEITSTALRAAAGMVSRLEEAADIRDNSTKAENAHNYEKAIRLSLELQRQANSLLEAALEAASRRSREAHLSAPEVLKEAKKSILSMASGSTDPDSSQGSPSSQSYSSGRIEVSQHTFPAEACDGCPAATRVTLESTQRVHHQWNLGKTSSSAGSSIESPERAPQTAVIELKASPFRSFAALGAFHRAVQKLPGVTSVEALAFDRESLQLAIEYSGSMPLAGRLAGLSQFGLRLVVVEDERIEVMLGKDNSTKEQKTEEGPVST